MNKNITEITRLPIENITLLHNCCSSGRKMLENYMLSNPDKNIKVNYIGIFNAKEKCEKLGIKQDDLRNTSYLLNDKDEIITKEQNNQ